MTLLTSFRLNTNELNIGIKTMRAFLAFIIYCILSSSCSSEQYIKIATYNIYFLDDGISQERKSNLQAVITNLNADVIGFQEINNPAALKNILPENYEIAMIDDPSEVQETALAVRPPFKIKSYQYVFPDQIYDDAFPRKRDLLQVTVEGYDSEFYFFVHHAKSRSGGRLKTDKRREACSILIVEYIKSNLKNKKLIILGDFNDNPDDRSLNILEYGDKNASGGIDEKEDTFLFNTTEQLLESNYCSYGYNYIYEKSSSDTFKLAVEGSREENNKWRNIEHNFRRDVKVKTTLFDQIMVSMNLKESVFKTGVINKAVAVEGESSRIRFIDDELHYVKRGSVASDHVPVWTILKFDN